jgi:hypothetical protein
MNAGRARGAIAFWALAGVALLVSHDAIFLVQRGRGEGLARALRDAGHDYWPAASAVLVALALLAGLGAVIRLGTLRRRAAALGVRPSPPSRFLRRAAGRWLVLLVLVATGFMLQESVEHFVTHGHFIGPAALAGPEYPLALPVIAVITAVAALVATAISGVELALEMAIARALAARPRRPATDLRRASVSTIPHHLSILSHTGASRAPPAMLAT